MATVEQWTGREAGCLRTALRLSVEAMAAHLGVSPGTVSKWERRGRTITPLPETQSILDVALARASPTERQRFQAACRPAEGSSSTHSESTRITRVMLSPAGEEVTSAADDEVDAVELARRVAADDVGELTLRALELAVDELACDYQRTPPLELLARTRSYLRYVVLLMDARMALSGRRRLMTIGGWLSLLAATCDIDLGRKNAAAIRLRAAEQLAGQAEDNEILAWVIETRAWQHLIEGRYREAVELARAAQSVAPQHGSAFIQATAQEGRAWARLGSAPDTRGALSRVERLVEPLAMPERAEHHFMYDPAKSEAYLATTLAWLGDRAAEPCARSVLARIESPTSGLPRARRGASARLDLSLALLEADQPDEAVHRAMEAVTSGRLVPSNHWRAAEIVKVVEPLGVPGARALREAYDELTHHRR